MRDVRVRIPAEKRDLLKTIAEAEGTTLKELLSGLINEYVERHQETLDLLRKPQWVEAIMAGKKEVEGGVKGTSLEKLSEQDGLDCPGGTAV